jgi:hypothetical protein
VQEPRASHQIWQAGVRVGSILTKPNSRPSTFMTVVL